MFIASAPGANRYQFWAFSYKVSVELSYAYKLGLFKENQHKSCPLNVCQMSSSAIRLYLSLENLIFSVFGDKFLLQGFLRKHKCQILTILAKPIQYIFSFMGKTYQTLKTKTKMWNVILIKRKISIELILNYDFISGVT